MFKSPPEARVIGPSSFPKPSDKAKKSSDEEVVVALKPTLGQHRPNQDAVVMFAAEYGISVYSQFIESLRGSGYEGDIVLSVHKNDLENQEIMDYLGYYANGRGVVVYTPKQVCYTKEQEAVDSANGGARTCKLHEVYGKKQADGTVQTIEDPRDSRTLQNLRYEVYWAMIATYNPNSWMLLVDARDTVFQDDPFAHVPRNTDPTGESGLLYFFGESAEASNIGKSAKFNFRWIRSAYGIEIANAVSEKPIICSGATMGEAIAIETYLRAMVAEADETGTVLVGSDQGFHNRLFYSNKLANADRIHAIVVFDQGTGIVNNLAALRSKELPEWGNGKVMEKTNSGEYKVNNWDGSISPVVHQFDRHKEWGDILAEPKEKEITKIGDNTKRHDETVLEGPSMHEQL
eukprot:CAMPEP_0198147112 /NCGR_PEP_ID=MMETSP1443-20131203/33263_1 /TAXON_ID=186043 /ORGANISM="Entomoneis sp., Strain CCMP2396" /LENGTH=403 /DNA_ID=CAMNT_0043811273 /DNA_START=198 /DNA_END=1406 /DNA_ORIENTATION=+